MSTIMGTFGSASSAMTSYQAGKAQNKLAQREATYKEVQSAEEARRMENELATLGGVQKTRYAASGVRTDEGSPMDVMLQTQREGQREIEFKKLMDAVQASEIRKAGKLAEKAGGYGALGSLFTGLAGGYKGGKGIVENWNSKGAWSLLG